MIMTFWLDFRAEFLEGVRCISFGFDLREEFAFMVNDVDLPVERQDLEYADFERADFDRADFDRADLERLDFVLDFVRAVLAWFDFDRFDFARIDFVDLLRADFRFADLLRFTDFDRDFLYPTFGNFATF